MYISKDHFNEQFMKQTNKKWQSSQKGFLCTTMDKIIAQRFAHSDNDPTKVSVILEIFLKSDRNYFVLDDEDYSEFIEEREVLLQEGL